MSELMDDDGENQAVRMFLLGYGAVGTVKAMREHLEMAGFDKHWPDWVEAQDGHLTKAGAQDWLRYLFGLEHNALKEQAQVPEGWKLVPVVPTADMIIAASDGYETGEVIGPASCYRVMIAAAPALPQVKSEDARDSENLLSLIGDIAKVAGRDVPDCVDNDGQPYQSAALDAAIKAVISAQD